MKKVFFIFLVIFSLLIINGKEFNCETKSYSFNMMERYVMQECKFVENGIKVEYIVNSSLEEENLRIVDVLSQNYKLNVTNKKNNISAEGEDINYSVKLMQDKELLKVELIILNSDEKITNNQLEKIARSIENDKFIDERYFSFIKGKINVDDNGMVNCGIVNEIKSNMATKSVESVKINNGYSIKATMKDEEKINIGQINYDTGSYLIIGTPIIFITY